MIRGKYWWMEVRVHILFILHSWDDITCMIFAMGRDGRNTLMIRLLGKYIDTCNMGSKIRDRVGGEKAIRYCDYATGIAIRLVILPSTFGNNGCRLKQVVNA
jgi:hypothetical protein